MWPFKEKKIYLVKWRCILDDTRVDIVKARDMAQAWKIICREHTNVLECLSMTEITDKGDAQ